jgi:hypothetical protein
MGCCAAVVYPALLASSISGAHADQAETTIVVDPENMERIDTIEALLYGFAEFPQELFTLRKVIVWACLRHSSTYPHRSCEKHKKTYHSRI